MLMTTTPIIEGKRIVKYYGIVSGETIIGQCIPRLVCKYSGYCGWSFRFL